MCPSTARDAVPIPALNSWQIMPVPPPTFPSATSADAAPSAESTCAAVTRCARMSLRKPSYVSPTTGSDQASSSAERAAIASRTTPTLNVFVIPIGVVSRPDSRTHSRPVSSPFPFSRWQPANNGTSGGTITVTPVRIASPSMSVECPTRTPPTSVIAFRGPGLPSPIAIPSSRARTGTPYVLRSGLSPLDSKGGQNGGTARAMGGRNA